MISLAFFGHALWNLDRILAESPGCLTEEQLRELAHRVAAYRGGNITLDFTAERTLFDDILQRAYTDDGRGGGRMTAAGLNLFHNIATSSSSDNIESATWFVGPGLSALIAGRTETRDQAERFFDEIVAAHQGPPWLWEREKIDALEKLANGIAQNPLKLDYMLQTLLLAPPVSLVQDKERAVQQRDATEVVIALVLFHRRHGVWPQTLEELVPDLLPAVPPDRFDGHPLRYFVRDGKPILYSIGVDRDDDGGRPANVARRAMPGAAGPTKPDQHQSADEDGDWILWPPVSETVAESAITPPPAEEE